MPQPPRQFPKWGFVQTKRAVTFGIHHSEPDEVPARAFQQIVNQAFSKWSNVAEIDFTHEVDAEMANIQIDWAHFGNEEYARTWGGCTMYGESLIERSYKPIKVEINLDYEWSDHEKLMWITCHELGHAIGIEHIATRNGQNLMERLYIGQSQLGSMDVWHAVQRYSART